MIFPEVLVSIFLITPGGSPVVTERYAMEPQIYTPEQLAERWSCSTNNIRQMISSRLLLSFRVGRLIRVRHSEVIRFEQSF